MKRSIAFVLFLVCILGMVGCSSNGQTDSSNGFFAATESVNGFVELSQYSANEYCVGYGTIKEVRDGKLLISPGSDEDKKQYGEVVWLICDYAGAYSVGQVVTYTFCVLKAPDKDGEPLNIIALSVYME